VDGTVEVFIAHPGGPFWAKRDAGAWSVVKGEYDPQSESPETAAEREFTEETGLQVPEGARVDLGEIRQRSGKRVQVWAVRADNLADGIVDGNTFEMEWPPRSGKTQCFPEIDRTAWMSPAEARVSLVAAQAVFLDRLRALPSAPVPVGELSPLEKDQGRTPEA
jgi:predicted NUDIX family NTP pyrophosphohydrolase